MEEQMDIIMSAYQPQVEEALECFESLRREQENTSFKLIIVVDGGDLDWIKSTEFCWKHLNVEWFIETENKGLPRSLNLAIAASRAPLIARMDIDDRCSGIRFRQQIQFLMEHPDVDIVSCWARIFGAYSKSKKTPVTHKKIADCLYFDSPLIHPGVMAKREVFEQCYNESFLKAQDYELWIRCINLGYRMATVPEFLLDYRVRNAGNSSVEQRYFARQAREKYIENSVKDEDVARMMRVLLRIEDGRLRVKPLLKVLFTNTIFNTPIIGRRLLLKQLIKYIGLRGAA